MDTDVATLQRQLHELQEQLRLMRAPGAVEHRAAADMDEDEEYESETTSAERLRGTLEWDQILERPEIPAETLQGQQLCDLLSSPPPLASLANQGKERAERYIGVPKTVAPRKHVVDKQLWTAQWKMERTMHELVRAIECDDKSKILKAAAFTRSAWEDIHQQRRGLMAGRGRGQLDTRPDEDRPTLLTKEEEQKIRRGRPQSGKGGGFHNATWDRGTRGGFSTSWGQHQPNQGQWPRPRSTSWGHKKGKGKGSQGSLQQK